MTEASPATHTTSDDAATMRAGSVGMLVAEHRVPRRGPGDGRGRSSPDSRASCGSAARRSCWATSTGPTRRAATVDAGGWLHTGDIGYADADGHFFIVDRLKELIKYKGLQIAPAELESVLLSHPAVADAAVVPQKDDEAGEIPYAFVVLKGAATAEELMAFVAGAGGVLQENPPAGIHRRHPEVAVRKDPAAGAARLDRSAIADKPIGDGL